MGFNSGFKGLITSTCDILHVIFFVEKDFIAIYLHPGLHGGTRPLERSWTRN